MAFEDDSTIRVQNDEVESDVTRTETNASPSVKANELGGSLKDLVRSLGDKVKEMTEENSQKLKSHSVDLAATADAREISHLGPANRQKLLTQFETMMTEMRRESYNDQARLLAAYKSFLEEQVRVITARMVMAKRLKPGG